MHTLYMSMIIAARLTVLVLPQLIHFEIRKRNLNDRNSASLTTNNSPSLRKTEQNLQIAYASIQIKRLTEKANVNHHQTPAFYIFYSSEIYTFKYTHFCT